MTLDQFSICTRHPIPHVFNGCSECGDNARLAQYLPESRLAPLLTRANGGIVPRGPDRHAMDSDDFSTAGMLRDMERRRDWDLAQMRTQARGPHAKFKADNEASWRPSLPKTTMINVRADKFGLPDGIYIHKNLMHAPEHMRLLAAELETLAAWFQGSTPVNGGSQEPDADTPEKSQT